MITGFNTDIPFEGTTYHVQTEDKGLKTPLILSLVYVGGTIIASKRTPYKDLIESGFDEKALTERLQRQHKLICAAIKAGRVEDLKRMSGGEGAAPAANGRAGKAGSAPAVPPPAPEEPAAHKAPQADAVATPPRAEAAEAPEPAAAETETTAIESMPVASDRGEPVVLPEASAAGNSGGTAWAAAGETGLEDLLDLYEGEIAVLDPLHLSLLDEEGDLKAGEQATLRIHVGRGAGGQTPAPDASVTVKILGSTFRPLTLTAVTDSQGLAVVRLLLPRFTSGRAAVIMRATADGETTELRRIIHHS
ncbi:MAG TPA: hypothetical protein VEY09_00970 [Pyrinomonadaceae bacterium]|nr:hypothetical protein [Pyrinomonadaceae bacterium]